MDRGHQDAASLGIAAGTLAGNPGAAEAVDNASQAVSTQRVTLAAQEHANLDTFQQLDQDQIAITTEALSNIEDTDYAAEAANLAQSQVLSQGAMAALAYNSRQNATQLTQLLDSIA